MKVTKIERGMYHVDMHGEVFQVEDMRYYGRFLEVGNMPWEIKHIETNAYAPPSMSKREAIWRLEKYLFDDFIRERAEGFLGDQWQVCLV
jgi:hypothetical protein